MTNRHSFVLGAFHIFQLDMMKKYGPICRFPLNTEARDGKLFGIQVTDAAEAKRLINLNPPKVDLSLIVSPLLSISPFLSLLVVLCLPHARASDWVGSPVESPPGGVG